MSHVSVLGIPPYWVTSHDCMTLSLNFVLSESMMLTRVQNHYDRFEMFKTVGIQTLNGTVSSAVLQLISFW